MMSEVVFQDVTKSYDSIVAVKGLNLEIERGTLLALLGPSGCGKTTCLRMLGGFIEPTHGTIKLQGRDVTNVPPHKRNTAMVFQSYALFPHLNVFDNVAYGLRRQRVGRAELRRRVEEALELVRIRELEKRYPRALSGGQQQRVAVARALVLKPAVLLLDEPFSALDAQVRESTRVELRRIQQDTGITAMLVTHDQQEAMSVADKVLVMNQGHVEQTGTPVEIYDRPASRFVAEFIGSANIFEGVVRHANGGGTDFQTDAGFIVRANAQNAITQGKGIAVVRSEDIAVQSAGPAASGEPNQVGAKVAVSSFLGTVAQLVTRVPDGREIVVRGDRSLAAAYPVGAAVSLSWNAKDVRILSR
jgi:ABC-type Fe3+/spermidine/putrescine transport system ATPase subunit